MWLYSLPIRRRTPALPRAPKGVPRGVGHVADT